MGAPLLSAFVPVLSNRGRRLLQQSDSCQQALNSLYYPLEQAAAAIVTAQETGNSAAIAYQCNSVLPSLQSQVSTAEQRYCTSSSVDTTAKATVNNILAAFTPYCGGGGSSGLLSLSAVQNTAAWVSLTVLDIAFTLAALAYLFWRETTRAGRDATEWVQGQPAPDVKELVRTLQHSASTAQWNITRCLVNDNILNQGRCIMAAAFIVVVLPTLFLCAASFQPLMMGFFIYIIVTLSCLGYMRNAARAL